MQPQSPAYQAITEAIHTYTDVEHPEAMAHSRQCLTAVLQQYGTQIACMEYLRQTAIAQGKWAPMTHRGGLQKMLANYHQQILPRVFTDYQQVQYPQEQTNIEAVLNYFIFLYGQDQIWMQHFKNQAIDMHVWEATDTKIGIQILLQQKQMHVLRETLEQFKGAYPVTKNANTLTPPIVQLLNIHSSDTAWMIQYKKLAKELNIWEMPDYPVDLQRITTYHEQMVMQAAVRAYMQQENKSIVPLLYTHRNNDLWVAQLESYAREQQIWEPSETHRGILALIIENDNQQRIEALKAYKGAMVAADFKLTHATIAYLIHRHSSDLNWLAALEQEARSLEIWFSTAQRNGIEKLVNMHLAKKPIQPMPVEQPIPREATEPVAEPIVAPVTAEPIAAPVATPPKPSTPIDPIFPFPSKAKAVPVPPQGSKKWSIFTAILVTALCITFMTPVSALLLGVTTGLFTFGVPYLIARLPEMPQPHSTPPLRRHANPVIHTRGLPRPSLGQLDAQIMALAQKNTP